MVGLESLKNRLHIIDEGQFNLEIYYVILAITYESSEFFAIAHFMEKMV